MQCLTDIVETPSLRNVKIKSEILLSCFYQVFQEDAVVVPEHRRRPFPSISGPVHHRLSYALLRACDSTELSKLSYSCV